MSFINKALVDIRKPLVEARFPFKRSSDLKDALEACVVDYYTKASIGRRFEARGVLVIGESRQGKSTEIEMMLEAFYDEAEIMPNGRPGKIISCLLSGKVTWKDLGIVILEELGYPLRGRNSQTEIWSKVRKYAELQGVIGIHFDECQHVFSDAHSTTNRIILDSFKSLLKDHDWPLMLIFSGVPSLATYIAQAEQTNFLLEVVSFDGIDLSRAEDKEELLHLFYSYGDRAGLLVDDLATEDFLHRLSFSACFRWGLVIELLIDAFSLAACAPEKICTIDHFSAAFSKKSKLPKGYSPFTMRDYQDNFDPAKVLELIEKGRKKCSPGQKGSSLR